jgi:hypothetical protein
MKLLDRCQRGGIVCGKWWIRQRFDTLPTIYSGSNTMLLGIANMHSEQGRSLRLYREYDFYIE